MACHITTAGTPITQTSTSYGTYTQCTTRLHAEGKTTGPNADEGEGSTYAIPSASDSRTSPTTTSSPSSND